MSGATKYKVKNGKGAKITIKIFRAIQRKNPPVSEIRAMIEERNELLQDQCKVDVEQELERLLTNGREKRILYRANSEYRKKNRRAKDRLSNKKEHARRMAEIRQRRINAAQQWEASEKELIKLIHKYFPSDCFCVSNRFGSVVALDASMSIPHNIKLKDKYIALVHAGDDSVSMLVDAVHAVDFDRSALDFWNNELFGDECYNANKINYEYA